MAKRIIYVPGKNLKPEPEVHRHHLWRSLVAGVRRVQPELVEDLTSQPESFFLAPWNHLFYGRHISLDKDIPWIDRLLETSGPTTAEKREAAAWHKVATKLMYVIGDRFHGLIKWIPDARVKAMVADTAPYFDNQNNVANEIRDIVKRLICEATQSNERVLLIGHSMGSVIAYEALWQLTHVDKQPCRVELFLTIGSPLGMRYVQKHLLGFQGHDRTYPHDISHWENVSAVGDLISVDETMQDDFAQMIEHGGVESIQDYCAGVYNWFRNADGLNVHRSYGYLVNPVVGQIVADWWQGRPRDNAPIIVAHRGSPAKYPENTLIGYEKAVAAGARFVELDVQLSKDKVPIVYHDPDTLRMSGVPGSLFELTLSEIKQLDAYFPKRFGERYRGNPIPTLSEFCLFMKGLPEVGIFVEIKPGSVAHFGLEQTVDQVMAAIKPIINRSVVISFNDNCVDDVRVRYGVRIGWILPKWSKETEARAHKLSPEFIFVSKKVLPTNGCRVWSGPWQWAVYVVDDSEQANAYPAKGIRYVETDQVEELLADSALRRGHEINLR